MNARRRHETFVAIDFETANRDRNSACQIGLVRVEDGEIVRTASLLIQPPTRAFFFTKTHGIDWDTVCKEPTFAGRWTEIQDMLRGADFVAAHNARFDREVLEACCMHHGLPAPRRDFLCTMRMARELWAPGRVNLPAVMTHLGMRMRNHHDALADARACAKIVLAAKAELGRKWAFSDYCY
jgi:DNA polymerase-3 subunit epsilon